MAVKPVVYDDSTKKHRPLGSGEKMDGLSASSIISSQSGNLITTGSDGLAYATGSGIADPAADNLIEATPAGKLKVDMDRIIEWLDGHPSDAKDVASAINVVSADSGNVIIEGTDNGAYLSKAALSNAIGSMTDAQLQALASAIADGQTIVASGGKLIVDPTNATAAKLKKITAVLPKNQGGIVADSSTGKLYVDFDAMSADTKRNIVLSMVDLDGGLAVHDSGAKKGTLYVDFSRIDDDTKRDIVLSIVDLEGGLAVYDTGPKKGKLYVDFSRMPPDKFNQLRDSLNMQRTLEANKTIFVDYDSTAADDEYKITDSDGVEIIDPNRGKESKPFKTIYGAVKYATRVYALGAYHIIIRVKARSLSSAEDYPYYKQSITLPTFTVTSGYIEIQAFDYANPPRICNVGPESRIFNCTGGTWRLTRLKVQHSASNAGAGNHFPVCIGVSGGGSVTLYGMELDLRFVLGTGETKDEGYYLCRMMTCSTNGLLSIRALSGYQTKLTYDKGAADGLQVIHMERNGAMQLPSDTVADIPNITSPDESIYAIYCHGVSSTFLDITTQSNFSYIGGQPYYLRFVWGGSGSPSGKRYNIATGSGAYVPKTTGTAAGTACPGADPGTVGEDSDITQFSNPPTVDEVRSVAESLMGCWYKEGTVGAIPYSS